MRSRVWVLTLLCHGLLLTRMRVEFAAPSLTRVEAKEAILRWYAPAHGAHKYILQQRAAENSDNLDRLRTLATQNTSSANNGEEDWTTVYEGQVRRRHVLMKSDLA